MIRGLKLTESVRMSELLGVMGDEREGAKEDGRVWTGAEETCERETRGMRRSEVWRGRHVAHRPTARLLNDMMAEKRCNKARTSREGREEMQAKIERTVTGSPGSASAAPLISESYLNVKLTYVACLRRVLLTT
jgi:hypothetical protein